MLIMSPWNYPFMLTLEPLADAIAAGNTAILKPSAYSPATSAVIKKLVGAVLPEEYVAVIEGGRAENQSLLEQKFDYIFFTGGTARWKAGAAKGRRAFYPGDAGDGREKPLHCGRDRQS